MDCFTPAVTKFLLHASPGKLKPGFVDVGAKLIFTCHPHENRRGVGHGTKTSLTLQQRLFSVLAPSDIARHPTREGGFAMFV